MNDLVFNVNTGNIVNHFLDKIENSIGWVVNKETPKKIAKQTLIKEIQSSNLPVAQKVAMISNINRLIKEYCNQYKIIELSAPYFLIDDNIDNLNDDWIHLFMDKARFVSNENFQLIWSKILVSEVNIPNSIPKQLLFVLEKMDKDDAEAFSKIVSISIYTSNRNGIKDHSPVVFYNKFIDYYNEIDLTYDDIVSLSSLGLIETDIGPLSSGYVITNDKPKKFEIHYGNKLYISKLQTDKFRVGNMIYTKSGNALCNALVANVDKRYDYFEKYCIPYWDEEK